MIDKEVVLTGLRTNGEFHLGHYIGVLSSIEKITQQADKYQVNLFIPDLHSFTTPIDHSKFFKQTVTNTKLFVASGIPLDHPNVNIYRQSYIPAHSQLMWILSNFTGFGEMSRMIEFKEKADRMESERVSVGLFNYPILMASDILLYGAKWVPVGEDQRQHLEFTRTIAQRMNKQFGDIFTVPESLQKQQEFVGRQEASRIKSLQNPDKKMSKSVNDPNGTIMLSDSPDIARKKIMSAETDSVGKINYDPTNQPGISNLLTILANLKRLPVSEVAKEWQENESYGELKTAVADEVSKLLGTLQSADVSEEELFKHLEESELKMNDIANAKLLEVQKAIGLRR